MKTLLSCNSPKSPGGPRPVTGIGEVSVVGWIWFGAACSTQPEASDLWLQIAGGTRERVQLRIPAGWLATADDPVVIETTEGSVDLGAEARRLAANGPGKGRSWTLANDGDPLDLTLSHEAALDLPVTSLALAALGPKGRGLTVSLPLSPETLGPAQTGLDANLDVEGLQIDLDADLCAQLRRSGPATVLEVVGPEGGTFRLSTE